MTKCLRLQGPLPPGPHEGLWPSTPPEGLCGPLDSRHIFLETHNSFRIMPALWWSQICVDIQTYSTSFGFHMSDAFSFRLEFEQSHFTQNGSRSLKGFFVWTNQSVYIWTNWTRSFPGWHIVLEFGLNLLRFYGLVGPRGNCHCV